MGLHRRTSYDSVTSFSRTCRLFRTMELKAESSVLNICSATEFCALAGNSSLSPTFTISPGIWRELTHMDLFPKEISSGEKTNTLAPCLPTAGWKQAASQAPLSPGPWYSHSEHLLFFIVQSLTKMALFVSCLFSICVLRL